MRAGAKLLGPPSLPARGPRHAVITELWFVPPESGEKTWQGKCEAQSADLHVLVGTGEVLPERTPFEGFCIDFSGINLNDCLKFLL